MNRLVRQLPEPEAVFQRSLSMASGYQIAFKA
jgi:hypothetical protein